MLRRKHFSIIIVGFIMLSACKYGHPLLAVPGEKGSEVDAYSLGQTTFTREWHFLCLRTGVHIGLFTVSKTYNSLNRLIEKENYKDTWFGVCDGPNRFISKKTHYDTLGRKTMVRYSIEQNGFGSYPVFDETDYYKNGKKIKSPGTRRRQIINLHPDTTDKYIIVFRCDTPEGPSYNIIMGYNAFKNSNKFGHDDSKLLIIKTIDRYIKNKDRDTIILNADTMHWFVGADLDSWIGNEVDGVTHELLDNGNVKIYDVPNKKYLKQVLRRKERWHSNGCFARHGVSWFFRDVKTHKEIMEYEIDDKRIIRARF